MLGSRQHHGVGRRALLAGAGVLLASPAIVRAQGKPAGAALVIGNSKYQWEAMLPNVRRDAPDIARAFQGLGLQTELLQDATQDAMNRAIENFKASPHGNFAALYFAGHGANWGRDTYLVPVDADLSNPSTVKSLVPVSNIGKGLRARHRLFVFDNCRNSPADGWRQVESERAAIINPEVQRAQIDRTPNTLVLFSTAPGRVALDGPAGQNSPFAAALLRQLAAPSVDVQSISSKIRRDLLIATEGRQVLWDRNGYDQPFVLTGTGKAGAPAERAGWGGDPSRIIELTNAYAYAHEKGLPLPSGLVAHRPAGNSPDGRKVGSFKFEINSPALGPQPGLLVVLSVDEGRTAEIIWSVKGTYNAKLGKTEGGSIWRFVTANLNGDRLEFVSRDEAPRSIFSWRDANSGSYSQFGEGRGGGGSKSIGGADVRFTRLDG